MYSFTKARSGFPFQNNWKNIVDVPYLSSRIVRRVQNEHLSIWSNGSISKKRNKMCDKGKCAVQRREGAYNGIAQNLKYEIACLFDRESYSSFNHFSNRTDRLYEGRIDG